MLSLLMLLIQLKLKRAEIISKMDEGGGNTGHVTWDRGRSKGAGALRGSRQLAPPGDWSPY